MIKINLLPFRAARKKENVRRQVSIFLLTVILIAGCIFYYNILLSSKIETLKKNVETTKKEVKKYEKITAEIAEIKRKLELLNKKMSVIRNLELNRKAPAQLLDTMTKAIVPGRMWFSSFQLKGNVVTVAGAAIDNKTVADFMTRLESMKEKNRRLYRKVVVKSVQSSKAKGGTALKQFEVQFTKAAVKPPQKKKAEK